MKYGELTFGQMEAIVNRLGGMDGVRQFLAGSKVTEKAVAPPPSLLTMLGTVELSGTATPFVAKKKLTEGKAKTGRKTRPAIAILGDDFRANFLGKTEDPASERTLAYHQLEKDSLNLPIMDELGEKAETALADLFALIAGQPNGEDGPLLVNDCANIFYIKDANGTLWAISAFWDVDNDGWLVDADSVDDPDEWDEGSQVFSRN